MCDKFIEMVIEIELRSLMDMEGWRDLTEIERGVLSLADQIELQFLCPKDFNYLDSKSVKKALLEKNRLLEISRKNYRQVFL